jgi:hypothetical protein
MGKVGALCLDPICTILLFFKEPETWIVYVPRSNCSFRLKHYIAAAYDPLGLVSLRQSKSYSAGGLVATPADSPEVHQEPFQGVFSLAFIPAEMGDQRMVLTLAAK